MKENRQSPRPQEVKKNEAVVIEDVKQKFDFPTAIEKVMDGEKITRLEWKSKEDYGVLKDGKLMLHKANGELAAWWISDGDLWGKDWVCL